MLSLIGMPPLAGFFGKLYMFMEALNAEGPGGQALTWLVALGLLNSVFSAFYYVRVLKAMFLRDPGRVASVSPSSGITWPIVLATAAVVGFGLFPAPLLDSMTAAAVPMLSSSGKVVAQTAALSKYDTEADPDLSPEIAARQEEEYIKSARRKLQVRQP